MASQSSSAISVSMIIGRSLPTESTPSGVADGEATSVLVIEATCASVEPISSDDVAAGWLAQAAKLKVVVRKHKASVLFICFSRKKLGCTVALMISLLGRAN